MRYSNCTEGWTHRSPAVCLNLTSSHAWPVPGQQRCQQRSSCGQVNVDQRAMQCHVHEEGLRRLHKQGDTVMTCYMTHAGRRWTSSTPACHITDSELTLCDLLQAQSILRSDDRAAEHVPLLHGHRDPHHVGGVAAFLHFHCRRLRRAAAAVCASGVSTRIITGRLLSGWWVLAAADAGTGIAHSQILLPLSQPRASKIRNSCLPPSPEGCTVAVCYPVLNSNPLRLYEPAVCLRGRLARTQRRLSSAERNMRKAGWVDFFFRAAAFWDAISAGSSAAIVCGK